MKSEKIYYKRINYEVHAVQAVHIYIYGFIMRFFSVLGVPHEFFSCGTRGTVFAVHRDCLNSSSRFRL